MNQRATLQALDADILSAFAAAGMGDTGTYRSPDGDETSISYLFDDVEGSPTFGQALPAQHCERGGSLQTVGRCDVEMHAGADWQMEARAGSGADNRTDRAGIIEKG